VVGLRIPPLRERRDDIALLAEYFLERARRESGVAYRFRPEAMSLLLRYDWPGNVRELENAIERACALSSGPELYMTELPTQLHTVSQSDESAKAVVRVDERRSHERPAAGDAAPAIVSIAELEREAILNTIRQLHGDKLMAAKLLGIGKTTLYRKLKEYGISDT
jgi:two-component system response regulator HydG